MSRTRRGTLPRFTESSGWCNATVTKDGEFLLRAAPVKAAPGSETSYLNHAAVHWLPLVIPYKGLLRLGYSPGRFFAAGIEDIPQHESVARGGLAKIGGKYILRQKVRRQSPAAAKVGEIVSEAIACYPVRAEGAVT